jgi:hypothetical protein
LQVFSYLPAALQVPTCPGLLQLPQTLHSVAFGGEAFEDAAMPVLVQLQQLRYIAFHDTPGFTDAGLQQLTGLDLGRLLVCGCGLSDAICKQGDALELKRDPEKVSLILTEFPESHAVDCADVFVGDKGHGTPFC